MPDFDLILLGESSFTLDLKAEFEGKVNLLFLDNTVFKKCFSADYFPSSTFIPQSKEHSHTFGQLVSETFRFDLTTKKEVTQLLWTEELKESSEVLDLLEDRAAEELNIANFFLIEKFGESFLSAMINEFGFLIKNFKTLKNLYLLPLPESKTLKTFFFALRQFFSPGEQNPNVYNKYLLYSLLTKKAYLLEDDTEKKVPRGDRGFLTGITKGDNWELRFEAGKVTGKTVVSAIPPHLFSHFEITHPFKTDYDEAYYLLISEESVEPPCGMEGEVFFINDNIFCFINNDRKGIFKIFLPHNINKLPDPEIVRPVFNCLFPHIKSLPAFRVEPHIYPNYKNPVKKHLDMAKNIYFLKNFEYPYLGIDGELLYRKRLKEFLWKRLL